MAEMPQNYQIDFLDPADYSVWDQFVLESLQGTLFHKSAWAGVIELVFRRKFKILTARKDGRIHGGMVLWPKKILGLEMLTQAPVTPYQGIIHGPTRSEKTSSRIAEVQEISSCLIDFMKDKYVHIDIPLSPGIDDVRPYLWKGFSAEPRYTYTFPLCSGSELEKQFSQALRRKLRQIEHLVLETEISEDYETLIKYVQQSYRAHRTELPVSSAHLILLFRYIIQKKLGQILYLKQNGQRVAGVLVLSDSQKVYTLFAGISEHHRNIATEFMYTSFMQDDSNNGKEFDFLGADLKDFEQFKRSFGGELRLYFRVRYSGNRAVAALAYLRRRQHNFSRRVRG